LSHVPVTKLGNGKTFSRSITDIKSGSWWNEIIGLGSGQHVRTSPHNVG
jgi:hypothetical protein